MSRGTHAAARAAEVAGASRSAGLEARRPVSVRVVVDGSSPRWLALATRDALVPGRAGARLVVGRERGTVGPCDAAVALGAGAAGEARLCAASGEPTVLLVPAPLAGPAPEGVELVAVAAADELAPRLGVWLAGACAHPLAAASAFPVCRDAVCAERARACAARCAAAAALSPDSRADLPILCASQAALALELAAAHGLGPGVGRLLDVGGVCALGLLWRAVARALCARSPLPARATGAAVAAAGTLATAAALALRLSLEPGGRQEGHSAPRTEAAPRAAVPLEGGAPDGYVTIGGAR